MIGAIVLAAVCALLWVGSYVSGRRFGLLGLALTAGATLSVIWEYDAGLLISGLGLFDDGPIARAVTLSVLVLLPAVLLLFHGYSYKKPFPKIIGSSLFAVLAMAFLIEPLGYALPLEGEGALVYNWIVAQKGILISVGVVCAVIDVFLTKPAAITEKEQRKK